MYRGYFSFNYKFVERKETVGRAKYSEENFGLLERKFRDTRAVEALEEDKENSFLFYAPPNPEDCNGIDEVHHKTAALYISCIFNLHRREVFHA